MKSFAIGGSSKKNRFAQAKEEAEARKKREEDDAAKVFAEFVESFEASPTAAPKSFVRGGTIDLSKGFKDNESSAAAGEVYKPKPQQGKKALWLPPASESLQAAKAAATKIAPPPTATGPAAKGFSSGPPETAASASSIPTTGFSSVASKSDVKKSNFDIVGSEPLPPVKGSWDTGDTESTNLYVSNFHPDATEAMVAREFGRFGEIASIKIMWPRGEDKKRGTNPGFVSFVHRRDAEEALRELNDFEFMGQKLRIGWGKAMAKPTSATAHVVIPTTTPTPWGTTTSTVVVPVTDKALMEATLPKVVVEYPESDSVKRVIDRLAKYVSKEAHPFEQVIMEKEVDNPLFAFLFQPNSKDSIYYRWRVFSFAQGDSERHWRQESFQMYVGGPFWIPPKQADNGSTGSKTTKKEILGPRDIERERAKKASAGAVRLSDDDRDEFEDILRQLTVERSSICEAMAFALGHSDSSQEIAQCITESLSIPETPLPTKVARLYLVSDILHNSSASVPNAWSYRTNFEQRLLEIFEHLNQAYRSITGRITAESLKEQVTRVIRVWEEWMIYPQNFLTKLEQTFFKPAAGSEEAMSENVDGQPINVDGEPIDLDGEPINLDGEPIDLDGEPINLDGEPINLDGEPINLDGEPINLDGEPIHLDGEPIDLDGEPINLDGELLRSGVRQASSRSDNRRRRSVSRSRSRERSRQDRWSRSRSRSRSRSKSGERRRR